MKYLIGVIEKVWWLAAVVAVSSCAPKTTMGLRSLDGHAMSQLAEGGGTTGGNPGFGGLQTGDRNPNGAVSEVSMCVDAGSVQIKSLANTEAGRLPALTPAARATLNLRDQVLTLEVQGIALPGVLLGVDFDLADKCGAGSDSAADDTVVSGTSVKVTNTHGTHSTREVVHISLDRAKAVSLDKNTVAVIVDAKELVENLAGVQQDSDLPNLFGLGK